MTPLLSACRLVMPMLPSYAAEPEVVREFIEAQLARAAEGEDPLLLDRELLLFVKDRPELRSALLQLTARSDAYRATADRQWADAPVDAAASSRHVNAWVGTHEDDAPINTVLDLDTDYAVLLHIGAAMEQSLLSSPDSALPPQEDRVGVWLRAALSVAGTPTQVTEPLYLDTTGESFSCDCPFGSEHLTGCARRELTELAIRTPAEPATLSPLLIIYRGAVALHVQQLLLPVGLPGRAPGSTFVSSATKTFNGLGELERRAASVVVSPGTSMLTVNGLGFTAAPFSAVPGKSDSAVLTVRGVLKDIHLEVRDRKEISRYDSDLSKEHGLFLRDLAALAQAGSEVYTSLFTPVGADPSTPWSLPQLLRHEALLRREPPMLQISNPDYTDASVVWQAIYDLPLGSDPTKYQSCQSLDRLEDYKDHAPERCPFDEDHVGAVDVLCPWGFWGLSTLLEQPPALPTDRSTTRQKPLRCLAVRGPDLAPLDVTHFEDLQKSLGASSMRTASPTEATSLAETLAVEDIDVAYFYCHCGYRERAGGAVVDRYLALDDFIVTASDVIAWAQARGTWPSDHWQARPPLVVLNGCHTVEFSSRSLNSFVPAFTDWARAGGVIGTEITIHQTVANWVGESLMRELWDGATVAEALRRLRWRLLARGNLMGLAYSAYCSADFTLTRRTPT